MRWQFDRYRTASQERKARAGAGKVSDNWLQCGSSNGTNITVCSILDTRVQNVLSGSLEIAWHFSLLNTKMRCCGHYAGSV